MTEIEKRLEELKPFGAGDAMCAVSSMSNPGHAVPFMRWAEIGTAPKDGTRVLLYRAEWAEDVCIGFWSCDFDEWHVAGSGSPWVGPTHWANIPERPNVEFRGATPIGGASHATKG